MNATFSNDQAHRSEARLERSKDAREAQISLDIHASKLETIMLDTMRRFVKELLPWRFDVMDKQGLKAVLTLLDSGTEGAWGARFRFGWYREFVRKVSHLTFRLAREKANDTVRPTTCAPRQRH